MILYENYKIKAFRLSDLGFFLGSKIFILKIEGFIYEDNDNLYSFEIMQVGLSQIMILSYL